MVSVPKLTLPEPQASSGQLTDGLSVPISTSDIKWNARNIATDSESNDCRSAERDDQRQERSWEGLDFHGYDIDERIVRSGLAWRLSGFELMILCVRTTRPHTLAQIDDDAG
jgi:hypothetical protein